MTNAQNIARRYALYAVAATLFAAFVVLLYHYVEPVDYEVLPDGSTVYKVEIDGHTYLKTDQGLTHSASCQNSSHSQNQ